MTTTQKYLITVGYTEKRSYRYFRNLRSTSTYTTIVHTYNDGLAKQYRSHDDAETARQDLVTMYPRLVFTIVPKGA